MKTSLLICCSVKIEIWCTPNMSFLNLTGEDADPVKALVFRELRDASKRKKEEDQLLKDEEENRRLEERKEKNRRWRQLREEREKEQEIPEFSWGEENESKIKKKTTCICL